MGASLGSLGVSWAVLVRHGCVLSVLWVHLGTWEGVLEVSRGILEASWGRHGRILEGFGAIVLAFLEDFLPF